MTHRLRRSTLFQLLAFGLAVTACGGEDRSAGSQPLGAECVPEEATTCASGLHCEALLSGDGNVCAEPVIVRGQLEDALSGQAIASGLVLILDATGTPVAQAQTSSDGRFEAHVPVPRDADGSVNVTATWTLAASAQGYQPFPAGPRTAIPIQANQLASEPRLQVLEDDNTSALLLPLPDTQERFMLSGRVDRLAAGGLVVAELDSVVPAPYGLVSETGDFTVFNVPAATAQLHVYRKGVSVVGQSLTVNKNQSGIKLSLSGDALGAVSGSVNIVNAPGGSLSSVVLVPEHVFDPEAEKGPVPMGLRVPDAPMGPNVAGAFQFNDVPPGRYVVLAAFENDQLVRDTDANIAGTLLQTVEVVPEQMTTLEQSFKLTEHLAVLFPGASGVEEVTGNIEFQWADDSSEDRYHFVLRSALGELIWEQPDVPAVSGSKTVTLSYAGPALIPGMFYQFGVTSLRDGKDAPTVISRTEDLRGVFRYR